jgi:hypothetical protein
MIPRDRRQIATLFLCFDRVQEEPGFSIPDVNFSAFSGAEYELLFFAGKVGRAGEVDWGRGHVCMVQDQAGLFANHGETPDLRRGLLGC